jgi:hypothetical protein
MDAIDAIIARRQSARETTSPSNAMRKAVVIILGAASCLADERDKNVVRAS